MSVHLNDNESILFLNQLLYPSKEEIELHNALLDQIDNNINIEIIETGYEITIRNLNIF